ncbi:TPA: hypothetical protein QHT08_004163 [Escherichia coli]|nr:hypothetical protein [Escherichia coli]
MRSPDAESDITAHLYSGGIQTLAEACGKAKTTLKKERRNVITGKTQSEMIKLCGTALGVTQFNTRALGKSTGQAMVKIGEAMMHPNVPVRIMMLTMQSQSMAHLVV